MSEPPQDLPPSVEDDAIEPKKLIRQMMIGLVVLMVGIGIFGQIFNEQLTWLGQGFVERFGGPGVAACFFIPDAVPVPGTHEFCSGFAVLGGMSFWSVMAWATGGSLSGGTVGYFIGRKLGHTAWFERFMHGRGRKAWALVKRYGVWALALGAVSPIPYSVCCWSSGALEMRFWVFFSVSLLRIPRIAFYLWLIQTGLVKLAA